MRDDGRWTVDGLGLNVALAGGFLGQLMINPTPLAFLLQQQVQQQHLKLSHLYTYLASETAIMWGRVFEWEIGRDRLV